MTDEEKLHSRAALTALGMIEEEATSTRSLIDLCDAIAITARRSRRDCCFIRWRSATGARLQTDRSFLTNPEEKVYTLRRWWRAIDRLRWVVFRLRRVVVV